MTDNYIDFAKNLIKQGQENIDNMNARGITIAKVLYGKQVIKWIKELKRMKSLDQFINISPLSVSIRKLYEKHFILGALIGADNMNEIVKQQDMALSVDMEMKKYDEAIRILRDKKVISKTEYIQLSATMKEASFTVAQIERLDVLIMVREQLTRAMETGTTLYEFQKLLPEMFENYGVTPLKPHHIENVFRTNTQTVYNAARYERIQSDDNVPGLEYSAINDSRVRPDHLQWDGYKAPKTDPIWSSISPPLDYMCRCSTIPLTINYIKNNDIKYSKLSKKDKEVLKKLPEDFKGKKTIKKFNDDLNNLKKDKEKKADGLK